MSTHSSISLARYDDMSKRWTVDTIYCHFDGYLDGVGKILREHWSDTKKVEELIQLGDLSSLGKVYDKHASANKKEVQPEERNSYTFAYKDSEISGEDPARHFSFATLNEINLREYREEYNYLYIEPIHTWVYQKWTEPNWQFFGAGNEQK